jgi:glyoxylase I family protein
VIRPNFVDHLVFRVAEVARTERFYTALLGQPAHRAEGSTMYQVGDTRLFFTRSDKYQARPYEKEQVGLNHLAFGVRTLEELQTIRAQLDSLGVTHSGIKLDKYGQKEFIWLDDPDGIRKRKEITMSKVTVGDLIKKHGSSNRPATHFYHGSMKKIYKAHMKLRVEKAVRDFTNSRFRA